MAEQRVRVELPGERYDVIIERGALIRLGDIARVVAPHRSAVLITDLNVAGLYLTAAEASLRAAGYGRILVHTVAPGETNKSLATFARLAGDVLTARIDRRTPVIALGGGIVGDTAGFVAATVLRGVPFIQVPTTLLAMVDASVGGKVGVNVPAGKNLVGAFKQPAVVVIDPACLTTLPEREYRGGLAECVKHDVIRDAAGFALLEASVRALATRDIDFLADLIAHNVALKAAVVQADPYETGERAHLNFGHTFGHAFETVSDYAYAHGEAVSLGVVAATRLAVALKLCAHEDAERVIALLRALQLSTGGVTLNTDEILAVMAFDKKATQDGLRFVLPDRIGHVTLRSGVDENLVRAAIESVRH